MERLKLFPLNTVLFPGGVLPLHIFEPRYRQMLADCLASDRRFGLLFLDPDREGSFHMEPGRVGCVAEIEEVQPLPGGRSLIVTRGRERFKLEESVESDAPYFEGLVDEYRDRRALLPDIRQRRLKTLTLFDTVLDLLPAAAEARPEIDLEADLSFQLASILDLDPAWMQTLLELQEEVARLDLLEEVLRGVLAGRISGES
jgi:Lon protease-like protein